MRHRKATLTIEGMPLVTVPVGLANARRSDGDVSLNVCTEDGRKAAIVYRHSVTGEVYDTRPATRGVKIGKDDKGDLYGLVDTDAWNALNEGAKLHVIGFVPTAEVLDRAERVGGVHYVQIQQGYDGRSLGMIAKALDRKDHAAVVRYSVGTRERLGALIIGRDGVLVLLELLYAEKIATPDDEVLAPIEAEVPDAAVAQAEALIDALPIDAAMLDTLADETVAERKKLIEAAARGEAVIPKPKVEAEATVDLAAALAASIATVKPTEKKKRTAKKKAVA